jgi:hypothetical protein
MKTLTEFSTLTLRRAAQARAQKAAEGLEGDALHEALAQALGVPADRAARLVEALGVTGEDLDSVRLVRVFQGEKGPQGAASVGEFHYVVDRVARQGGGRGRRDDRGGERRGDRDRGERRGGGGGGGGGGGPRGGGGGGFGGGGFGGERGPKKPMGLSRFKAGAKVEEEREDRVRPGEVPRAGIGWQVTFAPRDPRDDRRGGRGRGPGGPRRDRRDDRRGPRPPRLGPDGQPLPDNRDARGPRGPRPDRGPRLGPDGQPLPPREPRGPRLGPDGQPLPPREPRLGPDGQPLPPREGRRGRRGGRGRGGGPGGGPRQDRGPRPEHAGAPANGGVNTAPPAPVQAETAPAGAAPADKPADGNDTQTS